MTVIKEGLLLWFKNFSIKNDRQYFNMEAKPFRRTYANNKELAKELPKPIIINFKKRTVYSGFKNNIWGADLADMELISKFNKGFRFLLCFIDIFGKYVWVVTLKDEKRVTITNAFQKILQESNRKSNKIWVDKRDEFYNNSFKKW